MQTAKKTTKNSVPNVGLNSKPIAHGVGRRKSAVARVWVRPGNGKIVVNGKDHTSYFDTDLTRICAARPLMAIPMFSQQYSVEARVTGGGMSGQADAVKLGIARALVALHEETRTALRDQNLLTVDDRLKERKKYGQKAARRKFQFVKR